MFAVEVAGFPAAAHNFCASAGSYLKALNSRSSLSVYAHLPKSTGTGPPHTACPKYRLSMIGWRSIALDTAVRARMSAHFGLRMLNQRPVWLTAGDTYDLIAGLVSALSCGGVSPPTPQSA